MLRPVLEARAVAASTTCRLRIATPEPANQRIACSTALAASGVPSSGTETRCSPAGGGSWGSGGTTTGLLAWLATASLLEEVLAGEALAVARTAPSQVTPARRSSATPPPTSA